MPHLFLPERFWSYVDSSGGTQACWPWTGKKHPHGYGRFKIGRVNVPAHRLAYELTFGPFLSVLRCLHRCDNPPCCNPDHLFLGTQYDNIQDRVRKGRNGVVPPEKNIWHREPERIRGERNAKAKLTDAMVREIRALRPTTTLVVLAKRFGVSIAVVSKIARRETWAHVA